MTGQRTDPGKPAMSDDPASFGDMLRRLRSAAGLSQEELAARAGLSRNGISNLERGRHPAPRLETLRLLADALGLAEPDCAALLAAARPSILRNGSEIAPSTYPGSLPAPLTRLIGREAELAALSAGLQDPEVRLLTVTGSGGVGKTRLAIASATAMRDAFPDGMAFVDLSPLTDAALVLPTIAGTLGVQAAAGQSLMVTLANFVSTRRLLLLLDNCEPVLGAAPELATLLGRCPGLTVLATSREPLRVRGEHEFLLMPLLLPAIDRLPAIEELTHSPAVALFVERACAVQPHFALTADNALAVAAICQRLDGLPLAIELAAARVKVLPPPALLARLEHRLPMLTGGGRDLPERQRTMRDAIAWSYDLLSPNEQALLRRLSVFAGGFTLTAADAVAGSGSGSGIFEGLASLIDQSLLQQMAEPEGDPRYVMLETIREYGLERLAASGETEDARREHGIHFLALAEQAAPAWWGPEPRPWLERLEAEHDNLRAALGWAVEQADVEFGFRLASALHWFWRVRGPVSEGRQWAERVLARCAAAAPALHARLLTGAGDLAMVEHDYLRAVALHEESLEVTRELGDRRILAWALGFRGLTAVHEGDLERADDLLTRSLTEAREAGDVHWIIGALDTRASIASRHGDLDRAVALLEEALAAGREAGAAWHVANVLSHLGDVAAELGDDERADRLYRDSLGQLWEIGDRRDFAGALAGFAGLVARRGDAERGARLCGVVDALLQIGGVNLPPFGQTSYERALAAARDGLGDAAFAAARAAGRALPPEAILAETERGSERPAEIIETDCPGQAETSFGLTPREREVLALLCQRLTDREIADALFVSPRTAGFHVSNVLSKIGAANRREAAALATHYDLT
jgi:predicted ATPase/DNA-binding CsgD family transcriptional regulator/DNA-binding XRE family transcriptional regulator